MHHNLVRRILLAYQLAPQTIHQPQKGYRNQSWPVTLTNGNMANVILYKNEPGIIATIRNANTVSDFLAARHFPTRQTLDKRIIRLQNQRQVRYAATYTYLPGQTIPWEAYTQSHIKLLGQAMSNMHSALKLLDHQLPHVADQYIQILGRMGRYFSSPMVQQAVHAKLGLTLAYDEHLLITALVHSKKLTNQQPLHMDFVRGNVLFSAAASDAKLQFNNLAITGILDFEKTAYGHPHFDIARTLAFLLVDCKHKTPGAVRKYFLYSGYAKRGDAPLHPVTLRLRHHNRQLLEVLVDMFLLYDFYKFLRHNPYEYLHQNEHFKKTRAILAARGLICDI